MTEVLLTLLFWAGACCIGVGIYLLRRHWRMYDDPKFAVRQARRESERLRKRPMSDRTDDDADGVRW